MLLLVTVLHLKCKNAKKKCLVVYSLVKYLCICEIQSYLIIKTQGERRGGGERNSNLLFHLFNSFTG